MPWHAFWIFNPVTKTFVYGKARRNDHPKPGDAKIA